MPLIHQTQPTPYTCNQTCLAMLLDVPTEDVIRAFPGDGMDQFELFSALDRCRFQWNAFVFPKLTCEGYYLVSVPSLNFEGGGHCIILESSEDGLTVYDPNKGREGKKFYSNNPADGGVPLRFWTDAVYVLRGGRLPQQIAT